MFFFFYMKYNKIFVLSFVSLKTVFALNNFTELWKRKKKERQSFKSNNCNNLLWYFAVYKTLNKFTKDKFQRMVKETHNGGIGLLSL